MSHAIFTSSLMASTTLGSKQLTIKAPANLDNGNVVVVGALVSGEAEVFSASQPAATSAVSAIAIIDAPEVPTDERLKDLNEFSVAQNSYVRARLLCSGDQFGLTADGFAGTPSVGSIVEMQADYTLKVVASLTSGSTKVGTIIATEGDSYIVRVV